MYETSRVQPDPYIWLQQLSISYDVNPEATMEQTAIGQDVKPGVILALKEAEEALRLATQYAEVTTLAKLEANKEIIAKDFAEVRAIREVFEHSWADAYPLLQKKTWVRSKICLWFGCSGFQWKDT